MTPPPKGIGGVMVPPRDWGPTIETIRAHFTREQERIEHGLLSLEKRYYDLQRSIDELSVVLEHVQRRIGELSAALDEVHESLKKDRHQTSIDEDSMVKLLDAVNKGTAKSEPPDIEIMAPSGRRIRGNGWPVVVIAIVALLIALLVWGPDFVSEIHKLKH